MSHLGVHRGQVFVEVQGRPGFRWIPPSTVALGEGRVERIGEVRSRDAQPDVPIGHLDVDHGAMRVRSNVSYNSSRRISNSPAKATSSRVRPPSESTGRLTTAGMRSRFTH